MNIKQELYKLANSIRRIYWYIFRPKTKGVKCLIEYNDQYLLIQTSYSGNYWTLPGGGVGLFETPEKSIRREIKEELNIKLKDIKLLGFYTSSIEYKQDTVFCYNSIIIDNSFHKNDAEISEAQWFRKDSLPENQSRALIEAILLSQR